MWQLLAGQPSPEAGTGSDRPAAAATYKRVLELRWLAETTYMLLIVDLHFIDLLSSLKRTTGSDRPAAAAAAYKRVLELHRLAETTYIILKFDLHVIDLLSSLKQQRMKSS